MRIIEENTALNKVLVTIYGLSTDNKPIEYADGSVFVEVDTDKIFLFDEKNNAWREL